MPSNSVSPTISAAENAAVLLAASPTEGVSGSASASTRGNSRSGPGIERGFLPC